MEWDGLRKSILMCAAWESPAIQFEFLHPEIHLEFKKVFCNLEFEFWVAKPDGRGERGGVRGGVAALAG